GIALANLVGVLSIKHIFIGGSLARFGEVLVKSARQEMQQRTQATQAGETCVGITTTLDTDIVLLGAASLLLAHELGLV
ncbi:MAG: hypothetical protein GY796_32035, partial [Chloroflexi bacterium]|nr:hypothetical protein [Chloroflexota bacterium]